ncbi:MAG: F0F1 ATP synthase subunit A [Dehalococcoidia bacterium]|nr:F0F1 ATP synthase subunit A [Dehalococcoidia bacterium]
MPQLGCSTKLLVIIAAIVAILFIVGLIGGAIGQALEIDSPGFLHVPILEIHDFFKGDALFEVGGFSISNTLLASWFTIILVVAIAFAATRKMRVIPRRLQGLVEVGLETLLNFVESVAGRKHGRRFFPVIATIFIFVIFNAYLALTPVFGPGINVTEHEEVPAPTAGTVASIAVEDGAKVEEGDVIFRLDTAGEETEEITATMSGHIHFEDIEVGDTLSVHDHLASIESKPPLFRSANTDINMTLALAIMAVFFIEFWGFRSRGFRHYFSEYINLGELFGGIKLLFKGKVKAAPMMIVTGAINVVMGGLEALSHMTRMISFTFRLFGNMTAGEILLLSATFLIPWIMAIPFYGLEILIGFIQALIFAGLTLVWASMAVAHAAEEHE